MDNPFLLLFALSFLCLFLMTVLSALMYVSHCSALRRMWKDGYLSGRLDLAEQMLKILQQSNPDATIEPPKSIEPKSKFEPVNGC